MAIKPALLLALLFLPLVTLRAENPPLTEKEVTALSLQASAGDKKAVPPLLAEYRRYAVKIGRGEPLTEEERDLYEEIANTLELAAPEQLAGHKSVPRKPRKSRHVPLRSPLEKRREAERRALLGETTKYFSFNEGAALRFAGSRRTAADRIWQNAGQEMDLHVVSVRTDGEETEILLLQETRRQAEHWLAQQILLHASILRDGFFLRREVVFNQPTPGTLAATGRQSRELLAAFPLEAGGRAGQYLVKELSATVKTPAGEFSNCLVIQGLVEEFVFAPGRGLVALGFPEEKWLISAATAPAAMEKVVLAKPERKRLERLIRKSCRKQNLVLDSILAAGRKEKTDLEELWVRALLFERERADPAQRRYRIASFRLERGTGKKPLWEIRAGPL